MTRKITVAAFLIFCFSGKLGAQQNIPNGSTALPAATFQIAPPAYFSGMKINAVREHNIQVPDTNIADLTNGNLQNADDHIAISYTDGLGRTIQVVQRAQSQFHNDVIQPLAYDSFGRQPAQYLPYANPTRTGKFRLNAFPESGSYNSNLYPGEQAYYAATVYDDTSLYRRTKSMRPGANGVASFKGVTTSVLLNKADDDVRVWFYDASGIPYTNGGWPDATILINESKGETGLRNREYKDRDGKTVLTKQEIIVNSNTPHKGWLCSYYVYDDMNRLRHIITPKVVDTIQDQGWTMTQQLMDDLCYSYNYDERGRVIYKKVPGQLPVVMLYDNADRPVLVQDGNLRTSNQWLFNKYDGLGRQIIGGKFLNSSSINASALAAQIAGSQTACSFVEFLNQPINDNDYTTTSNIADADIYAINYFDSYDHTPTGYDFCQAAIQALPGNVIYAGTPKSLETMGMATGSLMRIMDGITPTNQWQSGVVYYDALGMAIQSQGTNAKGGRDTASMKYNFMGGIISSVTSVNNPACSTDVQVPRVVTTVNVGYDEAGKLITTYQKINDEPYYRQLYYNYLDPLGKVKKHVLGENAEAQDYTYRIWGALESINKTFCEAGTGDNVFGEVLSYDYGYSTLHPDGLPAGMRWRSKGSTAIQRSYGYLYDGAGRLKTASYTQNSGLGWANTDEDYSAANMKYDGNGNILHMDQWGTKAGVGIFKMDDMDYKYKSSGMSNQLLAVNDNITTAYGLGEFTEQGGAGAATDYDYDDNGNATMDNNRNITAISYNHQNKPVLITFATGGRNIKFTYNAAGTVLSKTISETGHPDKVIDYLGNEEYMDNKLTSINNSEGRVRPLQVQLNTGDSAMAYEYDYFVKDHQGNVRSTITEEADSNWHETVTNSSGATSMEPVNYHPRSLTLSGYTTGLHAYTVTSELAHAGVEEATFDHVGDTRDDKPGATDSTDTKDAKLNQASGNIIGPSIMLRVMAGDKIDIKTSALYASGTGEDHTSNATGEELVAALLNALTGQGGYSTLSEGGPGAELTCNSMTESNFLMALQEIKNHNTSDGTKPQGFLNYVMFDDQMHVVSDQSGFVQTRVPDDWNDLSVAPITLKSNGYLVVFLSNESRMDIRFDNLTVDHYKGKLTDESQYYPYGLTLTSKAFTLAPDNNKLYAGKELHHHEFSDGTGLEWSNFGARQYDAQIGRWHSIDPLAEKTASLTPYHYCNDNPIVFSDPDGRYAMPQYHIDAYMREQISINQSFDINQRRASSTNLGTTLDEIGAFWDAFSLRSLGVRYDYASGEYMAGNSVISVGQAVGYYGGGKTYNSYNAYAQAYGSNNAVANAFGWNSKKYNFFSDVAFNSWAASAFCNPGKNINLPCFEAMWGNYPPVITKDNGMHFMNTIVNTETNPDGSQKYHDQCAIRFAYTLQKSGVDISIGSENMSKSSEGYFLGAKASADWLTANFGTPVTMTPSQFIGSTFSNSQGIIFMQFQWMNEQGRPTGSGHIDFWNGTTYLLEKTGSHNAEAYPNRYFTTMTIYFWPLK